MTTITRYRNLEQGVDVRAGEAFELLVDGEVRRFPRGWISKATNEEIEEIGLEIYTVEVPEPEPVATPGMVDDERDRRTDVGFTYKGKIIQCRDVDRQHITGAGTLAFMAIVNGAQSGDLRWADPDRDFTWIAADNTLIALDAFEMVEMGRMAAEWRRQHVYAGRALKDMGPIPLDYADDAYWTEPD